MWAGVLGALAGATRSAGVVLLVPALMLYLYGPREDRAPDFPLRARWLARAIGCARTSCGWRWCRPACSRTAPISASPAATRCAVSRPGVWGRHFAGPVRGRLGRLSARPSTGARQLLSFQRTHVYFPAAGGSPFVSSGHNLMLLAFLLAAVPAVVGVLRRLPLAYGAYVLAALALPLS